MALYDVYVFCDECSQPHFGGISGIRIDGEEFDKRSVGDIYDGIDLPPEIAMIKGNRFRCPNTGKYFTQSDNLQMFLVATSG